jgi:hypothetical protein
MQFVTSETERFTSYSHITATVKNWQMWRGKQTPKLSLWQEVENNTFVRGQGSHASLTFGSPMRMRFWALTSSCNIWNNDNKEQLKANIFSATIGWQLPGRMCRTALKSRGGFFFLFFQCTAEHAPEVKEHVCVSVRKYYWLGKYPHICLCIGVCTYGQEPH